MARLDVEISGEGRDLVLLHSLLSDRTSFAPLDALIGKERRLIVPDLPGFGASAPAAPLDGFADAVAQMMDELALPADTAVLGNGLGGFVALRLAVRHPGRLGRLVLVGSAIAFPEAGRATFRAMAEKAEAEGMAPLAGAAMLRMFPQSYIDTHPAVIADRRAVFEAIDAGVFAAACRALAEMDLRAEVPGIGNRVLIATGEMDGATLPALGRALADLLTDGQFVELAGLGHAPHIQAPETLLAAIGGFLGLGHRS